MHKMPKLKKQPKNAFYFYMVDRKVELERRGYRFPKGMQDVVSTCHPEYKALSAAQKEKYELLAKEAKENEKTNFENKFTTSGESYAHLNQRMEAERREKSLLASYVDDVVGCDRPEERIYVVMKAISACEVPVGKGKDEKEYLPLEFAIAAFSVKDGFVTCFSSLVNTVTVPCGYASFAKDIADETMLPQPGSKKFESEAPEAKGYQKIMSNIRSFVETWCADYPPPGHFLIFGADANLACIKGCLQWLAKNSGDDKRANEEFVSNVRYYGLPNLLIQLSVLAKQVNPAYQSEIVQFKLAGSADNLLKSGCYDYKEEITCKYHNKEDHSQKMHLCAKNFILRRVFLMLEELTPAFLCPLHGRHKINEFSKTRMPLHLQERIPKVIPLNRNPTSKPSEESSSEMPYKEKSDARSQPPPSTASTSSRSSDVRDRDCNKYNNKDNSDRHRDHDRRDNKGRNRDHASGDSGGRNRNYDIGNNGGRSRDYENGDTGGYNQGYKRDRNQDYESRYNRDRNQGNDSRSRNPEDSYDRNSRYAENGRSDQSRGGGDAYGRHRDYNHEYDRDHGRGRSRDEDSYRRSSQDMDVDANTYERRSSQNRSQDREMDVDRHRDHHQQQSSDEFAYERRPRPGQTFVRSPSFNSESGAGDEFEFVRRNQPSSVYSERELDNTESSTQVYDYGHDIKPSRLLDRDGSSYRNPSPPVPKPSSSAVSLKPLRYSPGNASRIDEEIDVKPVLHDPEVGGVPWGAPRRVEPVKFSDDDFPSLGQPQVQGHGPGQGRGRGIRRGMDHDEDRLGRPPSPKRSSPPLQNHKTWGRGGSGRRGGSAYSNSGNWE